MVSDITESVTTRISYIQLVNFVNFIIHYPRVVQLIEVESHQIINIFFTMGGLLASFYFLKNTY